MQIEWFEVHGYKNFRAPVRLVDLGRLNVLHGDNNVGKSNLLESIGLLFVALGVLREEARGGAGIEEKYARTSPPSEDAGPRVAMRTFAYAAGRGFPVEEIFHIETDQPIELRASIRFHADDCIAQDPPWLTEPIEVGVRLERREDGLSVSLVRLCRADGQDLTAQIGEDADGAVEKVLERFGPRRTPDGEKPRFTLIRADRTILTDLGTTDDASPLAMREPMPADLGLALYDAENATGASRQRFNRLIKALDRFRPLIGEGAWRMMYDRKTARAELTLERGSARLPLRLMGSGVQQIVVLLARLLITGADVIAIEEPEENLGWRRQHQLREALGEIVGERRPSQLFVTSHSDAFEFEPQFYAVSCGAGGPLVQRRLATEAPQLLNPEVQRPPDGARAPLSYVTTSGLVRLPDHAREDLGLAQGGGVVFVRGKDGHYRMLTNDQFVDLFEPREREA